MQTYSKKTTDSMVTIYTPVVNAEYKDVFYARENPDLKPHYSHQANALPIWFEKETVPLAELKKANYYYLSEAHYKRLSQNGGGEGILKDEYIALQCLHSSHNQGYCTRVRGHRLPGAEDVVGKEVYNFLKDAAEEGLLLFPYAHKPIHGMTAKEMHENLSIGWEMVRFRTKTPDKKYVSSSKTQISKMCPENKYDFNPIYFMEPDINPKAKAYIDKQLALTMLEYSGLPITKESTQHASEVLAKLQELGKGTGMVIEGEVKALAMYQSTNDYLATEGAKVLKGQLTLDKVNPSNIGQVMGSVGVYLTLDKKKLTHTPSVLVESKGLIRHLDTQDYTKLTICHDSDGQDNQGVVLAVLQALKCLRERPAHTAVFYWRSPLGIEDTTATHKTQNAAIKFNQATQDDGLSPRADENEVVLAKGYDDAIAAIAQATRKEGDTWPEAVTAATHVMNYKYFLTKRAKQVTKEPTWDELGKLRAESKDLQAWITGVDQLQINPKTNKPIDPETKHRQLEDERLHREAAMAKEAAKRTIT